jgi:hypothetical protein
MIPRLEEPEMSLDARQPGPYLDCGRIETCHNPRGDLWYHLATDAIEAEK